MQDQVIITHQGARYLIGRGPGYYGVWRAGQWPSRPIYRFELSAGGWYSAWSRFNELEQGGEEPVIARPAARTGRAGALAGASALLVVGIGIGFASLFFDYLNGQSLARQPDQLATHAAYLVTWAVALGLLLAGRFTARSGALLATGASLLTFGLYFTDAGSVISSGVHVGGAGLLLALLGWLAAALGSALALWATMGDRALGWRPAMRRAWLPVLIALAAIGVAATFAPAWDTFTLLVGSTGRTYSLTAGNAFAEPAAMIAGNVAVMVALVGVAVFALSWRWPREAAVLLAGALVPMVAQAISAIVQWVNGVGPSTFGLSPTAAANLHVVITSGFTFVFYLYCALLAVLAGLAARLALEPAGFEQT